MRRTMVCAAVSGILTLAAAAPARAHPGDWALDVFIRAFLSPKEAGERHLTVTIENKAPGALTLNGAVAPFGTKLTLERRRSLFGFETWQPVSHLRVDTGGSARLGPPEYRWRGEEKAMEDLVKSGAAITAFFSPLGRVVVRLDPSEDAGAAPTPAPAAPVGRPCPPGLEGIDGGC